MYLGEIVMIVLYVVRLTETLQKMGMT